MKKLITIPLLFVSLIISATNYYVKTGGNDSNTGLSDAQAWLTITKVNTVWAAGTFAPGDSILFNRGDTFTGTLTISESGTSGSPIIIGAYGTGADPIISGFTTLSSWVDEGDGVYSKAVICVSEPNMLIVNDTIRDLGRYPNTGWLYYESHSGNTQITDNQLGASPDWDGAGLVLMPNAWYISRHTISSHATTTITYTPASSALNNGYGYFINKSLLALDTLYEWYYNTSTSTVYMYFGEIDPTGSTVKISAYDYNINLSNYDYITIDNINCTGANVRGIYLSESDYITIQNCTINYCGNTGIYGTAASSYCTIDNCVIDECVGMAIYITDANSTYATITDNTITDIGMIAGLSPSYFSNMGVTVLGSNSTIKHNNITRIGYIGIYYRGTNIAVDSNLVTYFGMIKDDGGGIYTSLTTGLDGMSVKNNIVMYGASGASRKGTPYTFHNMHGIYLDHNSLTAATTGGVTVTNNTSAFNTYSGIYIHSSTNHTVKYNTSFGNGYYAGYEGFTAGYDTVENNSIISNKFIAKESSQSAYYHKYLASNGGYRNTADSNYYARPIDDDYVFYQYPAIAGYPTSTMTLAQWQTYSGEDANSNSSSVSVSDTSEIDFYYNATTTPDTIVLSYPMIDVTGTRYPDSLILQPYTSAVLMLDPNPPSTDFWYIDPAGDNENDGSSGTPWKTLAYAATQVTTIGDTIHINPGTYTETEQVVVAAGVNLYGVGETQPVVNLTITTANTPSIILSSVAEGSYGNQYISNIKFDGGDTANMAIKVLRRNNVHIHDCTFEDFFSNGVVYYGKAGGNGEPTTYMTGCKFYNNTVHDCSDYVGSDKTGNGLGALSIGGTKDLQIYNNTFTQDDRGAANNGYLIKFHGVGYNMGTKIYDNTFRKKQYDTLSWDFAIELWDQRGGTEIYNNTIYGSVDFAGYRCNDEGGYGYSAKIYNNTFLQDALADRLQHGLIIERNQSGGLYVYNNIFRNLSRPINVYLTIDDSSASNANNVNDVAEDLYFYYNVFENVGFASTNFGAGFYWTGNITGTDSVTLRNVGIYNNTMVAGTGTAYHAIPLTFEGAMYDINVKNNIVKDFSWTVYISNENGDKTTISRLNVNNNIFFNNTNNAPLYGTGSAAPVIINADTTGNIALDPLFRNASAYDFRLTASSPAINAGLDVDLGTDIQGYQVNDTPDIGAYEYKILKLRSSKFLKSGGKFLITR